MTTGIGAASLTALKLLLPLVLVLGAANTDVCLEEEDGKKR